MKPSERKQEILTAAAQLFKAKGYSAVTMRDLAQALDIKAASLYNHIRSKQEILELMIIGIAEEFTQTIAQIAQSETSSVQKLEQLIQLHVDITVRNPDALAALNNDWMHLPEKQLQYFLHMREEYEAQFRQIVKTGIEQGELKNQSTEVILFSLLSTLRTLYLWYGKKSGFSESGLKTQLPKILLQGIV
ncbi:MAG: TetR/AcrR family transcriptional regulator [Flavobacterium sp.]|jgi:AcrR family transcriptional regulator